jgi:hypothetical protein
LLPALLPAVFWPPVLPPLAAAVLAAGLGLGGVAFAAPVLAALVPVAVVDSAGGGAAAAVVLVGGLGEVSLALSKVPTFGGGATVMAREQKQWACHQHQDACTQCNHQSIHNAQCNTR